MARLEAAPYLWGAGTPNTRFDALRSGDGVQPVSIHGARVVTNTCLAALTGLRARMRPSAHRNEVRDTCQSVLSGIVTAMPSDSYAWYAGAVLHFQAGEAELANGWLAMSQRTGPSEQWIAEMRANLAEDHWGALEDGVKEGHLNDLALLAASHRGVRTIAQRYVEDAEFRDRITGVVEGLTPSIQERFLSNVRSAAHGL